MDPFNHKYDLRHLQSPSSTGDETNVSNPSLINDLNTVSNNRWKYANDTTLAEVIPRGGDSNIQSAVDDIQNQSNTLKFTLNEDKCKEMRI